MTSGLSRFDLAGSTILAALAEGLWLWSWCTVQGEPRLPAQAVWVWPLAWMGCVVLGAALAWCAKAGTQPGRQGTALAVGMLAGLFARMLLFGTPLVVAFFGAASVLVAR